MLIKAAINGARTDTLTLPAGSRADSNAALVTAARQIAAQTLKR